MGKTMSQLYARVFVKILESSIAEDFTLRHVFEDFLKVAEDGVVDATRTALARRFNIPVKTLNECITKLEQPDQSSRDEEFEGRRIERLDEHRDWGWRILNWHKWEQLRTRADVAIRVSRHRKKNSVSAAAQSTAQLQEHDGEPTREMALAWLKESNKNGSDYTEKETLDAWLYFAGCGWVERGRQLVDYRAALEEKIQRERRFSDERENSRKSGGRSVNRNKGTYNEGTAQLYKDAAVKAGKV